MKKKKAPLKWKMLETGRVRAGMGRFGCLTSNNGQLCGDGHLSSTVARHTFVDVLISGCSERLDPQHSAGTLVELHSLDSRGTTGQGDTSVQSVTAE